MFHIARDPTNLSEEIATSTRATSHGASFLSTTIFLALYVHNLADTLLLAIQPAAIPAKVPSRAVGNTLLVPVDSGINGISQVPSATARLVPSPPKVIITLAPCLAIRLAELTVSVSLFKIGMSR